MPCSSRIKEKTKDKVVNKFVEGLNSISIRVEKLEDGSITIFGLDESDRNGMGDLCILDHALKMNSWDVKLALMQAGINIEEIQNIHLLAHTH